MHKCMNQRTTDFDWNHARAFLATAQSGSFSAAARLLGMTQPTVGRQVAALEQELGVVLFERVGRGLELTPTGVDLLEHVRAMSEAAERVSMVAAGRSLSLDGKICITASEVISAHILPPIVGRLRTLHPGIEIELLATNTPSDLRRREADIAVRSFRPTTPGLFARKVRQDNVRLYASPDYLKRIGDPKEPRDLTKAESNGIDRTDALRKGLQALGLELTLANFPIITLNHLVHWELVKAGSGIGIIMEEIGDAEPRVIRALPQLAPITIPMWLTCHSELHTSRRVRVVFDLLTQMLTRKQH